MSRRPIPRMLTTEERARFQEGFCTNRTGGRFCTNFAADNGSPFGHCEDCDDDAACKSPVPYARAARRAAAPDYYEET